MNNRVTLIVVADVSAVLILTSAAWADRLAQGTKNPQRIAAAAPSALSKEPTAPTPEQLRRCEEALARKRAPMVVPMKPGVAPESIRPTSPESSPRSPAEALAPPAADACSFSVFRNTALTNLNSSRTNEPTAAVHGRVAFYTGNFYAAFSPDAGQSFTFLNPFDNFPPDGVNDPVNAGFCCDQVAYYERTRGVWCWMLQYNQDANTDTQRLAVVTSPLNQAGVLNNTWSGLFYDWTPSDFGFAATGFWLDFPNLAVSANFLFATSNVFQIGATTTSTAVAWRMPLNQLAQGQALTFDYLVTDRPSLRCTHGAGDIMWFAAHIDNTELRVWRWADSLSSPTSTDVDHNAYTTGAMTAIGPDGANFAGNADNRVLGAWRANGVLGFMWNGTQDASFPFPYVFVLRLLESDRSVLTQEQVWNNQFAWLCPSVHPNEAGNLGGTIAFGGGTSHPGTAAWIVDDCSTSFAPLDNLTFAAGNAGPANNRWGDYLATRLHVPYTSTWIGTGFALTGPGGGQGNNVVPRYVWFGRERDTPPAANTIRVDLANTSGWDDGSGAHPYNTVTEGHFAAMNGDTILIQPGNYPETLTFSTPSLVNSQGGTATIGP